MRSEKEYKPVRYIVLNEHTLAVCGGFIDDGWAQVLAGDKDGYNHLDGPVPLFGAQTRAAIPADFELFRVSIPPDFKPPSEPDIATSRDRSEGPR